MVQLQEYRLGRARKGGDCPGQPKKEGEGVGEHVMHTAMGGVLFPCAGLSMFAQSVEESKKKKDCLPNESPRASAERPREGLTSYVTQLVLGVVHFQNNNITGNIGG